VTKRASDQASKRASERERERAREREREECARARERHDTWDTGKGVISQRRDLGKSGPMLLPRKLSTRKAELP
jgi:hypothetical protein